MAGGIAREGRLQRMAQLFLERRFARARVPPRRVGNKDQRFAFSGCFAENLKNRMGVRTASAASEGVPQGDAQPAGLAPGRYWVRRGGPRFHPSNRCQSRPCGRSARFRSHSSRGLRHGSTPAESDRSAAPAHLQHARTCSSRESSANARAAPVKAASAFRRYANDEALSREGAQKGNRCSAP